MKIFDAHSDIFTDVTIKRLQGEKRVFERYHLEKLRRGRINASIFVIWLDPPNAGNSSWRLLETLGAVSGEIPEMENSAGIIYRFDDIRKIQDAGKIAVLMGMEGLNGLNGNISLLNMLYRFGIRHASLTWNEENEFATGAAGSIERGITPLGISALRRMEELGMLVDVSHSNERTFWDIFDNTNKPFVASHSNAYSLCPVPRNLKDDQIRAVAQRGGVIGMNSWPRFINESKPDMEHLADHVDYIADLAGIDCIGLGFDFCDFLGDDTTASFRTEGPVQTTGLEDASKAYNFIDLLIRRGYKTCDLEKIAFKNFERVLKDILG